MEYTRSVVYSGKSMRTILPAQVAKHLDIKDKDRIVFEILKNGKVQVRKLEE